MTCIVGFVEDQTVYMGGDSASSSGWDTTLRRDPKVFINGPFLFGFTSSWRMGQLLRFAFKEPEHKAGMDDFEFMVTRFIDEVRRCLKDGGYARKLLEEEGGGVFLVGYRGKLYRIDADYQVGIPLREYDAVGCGAPYALGAMFATDHGETPRGRLSAALAAAVAFSNGVEPPFVIESLRYQ